MDSGHNDLTTDRGAAPASCVPRPSPPSVNRQARGPSFVSTLMVATVSLPSRTARRAFRLEARRHADLPSADVLFWFWNVCIRLGIDGDVLGVKKFYVLSRACRHQPHHGTAAAPTGGMTPAGRR